MHTMNIATNMHTAAMKKYVKLTLLFVFSSHEFISHVEPESPSHIVISANTQNALYFMVFFSGVNLQIIRERDVARDN